MSYRSNRSAAAHSLRKGLGGPSTLTEMQAFAGAADAIRNEYIE